MAHREALSQTTNDQTGHSLTISAPYMNSASGKAGHHVYFHAIIPMLFKCLTSVHVALRTRSSPSHRVPGGPRERAIVCCFSFSDLHIELATSTPIDSHSCGLDVITVTWGSGEICCNGKSEERKDERTAGTSGGFCWALSGGIDRSGTYSTCESACQPGTSS